MERLENEIKCLKRFILLLFLLSCTVPGSFAGENLRQLLDLVYDLSAESDDAYRLLDSVKLLSKKDNYKNIHWLELEYANAYVDSRRQRTRESIQKLEKLFHNDSVQSNPDWYMKVTGLLANEYYMLNLVGKSMKYSLLNMKKAQAVNDLGMCANAYMQQYMLHRLTGNMREAESLINKALPLFENMSDSERNSYMVSGLKLQAYFYMCDKQFDKVDEISRKLLKLISALKPSECYGTELDTQEHFDARLLEAYLIRAIALKKNGKFKLAEKHYRLAIEIEQRRSGRLSAEISWLMLYYLISGNRWDESLTLAHRFESSIMDIDSININNIFIKRELCKIYSGFEDYETAYKMQVIYNNLTDSLLARENYGRMMEVLSIYKSIENDHDIYAQRVKIVRQRISFSMLLLFVFLMLGIWVQQKTNSRLLIRKNKVLESKINEFRKDYQVHNRIKEKTLLLKKQADSFVRGTGHLLQKPELYGKNKSADLLAIYQSLEKYMKQSFRNPGLTRDVAAQHLGTNRTYISEALNRCTGLTFNNYLISLRLDYACVLLADPHKYTIEAISTECGFKTSRTFYRLFREKFGFSPSQYRSTIKNRE